MTRTVTPGGSEPSATWTYAHTESGSAWTTTITDPNGNQTVMTFDNTGATELQAYQGSAGGTPLKTVYTCYNGAAPPCTGSFSLPITSRAVYTELPLGSTSLESETNVDYSSYGLPTEEDDYGYGSGVVGPKLRSVLTSYASLGNNIIDMPASVTVENGSSGTVSETTYSYDQTAVAATSGTPQHVSVSGSRGNVTTVASYVTSAATLSKTFTYFDTGNVDVATDVNGAQTSYSYGDCGNSFPTVISLPLSLSVSLAWDSNCNGGVVTSATDANNQTTSFTYNDPYYWRPAQTSFPDGGWQAFSYASLAQTDTYTGITNGTPSTSCSTGCRHDEALLDGLGRPYESILASDPDGQTTVTTTYDPANDQLDVTNPDRSGASTNGTTTTTYDALGRVASVKQPDGSTAYNYYGSAVSSNGGITTQLCSTSNGYAFPTLTIDPAGNKRETWTDALGRTVEVDEPNGSNSLTEGTCSTYDANGKLLSVAAPLGQTRTYQYDELGRVTSETTPESGTTTYDWDSSTDCSQYPGDLVETIDAKGNKTCYYYDALHRLTDVGVAAGPDMYPTTSCRRYRYDNTPGVLGSRPAGVTVNNPMGRVVEEETDTCAWPITQSSIVTDEWFSYDARGRVAQQWKEIAGVSKTLDYTYNYDGSLASLTYPDGRVVNYAYSNAQRPLSATDSGGTSYAKSATYAADGALASDLHGQVSGGFGGITETWGYNSDFEPTSVVASSSAGTALSLSYSYALPNGNNGTVAGVNNGNDSGRDETMTYDPLDRILTAQTQATSGQDCWGLNFGSSGLADDALGNLLSMSTVKCTGPSLSVSVNNSTNQITNTGFSYDSDGNATADGSYTYAFDGYNQVTSAGGVTYTYDADGLRAEKSSGTLYWRSYAGQVLEETDTSGNMPNAGYHDYIYFGGRIAASVDGTGAADYYFADALGSTRTVTTAAGGACFNADYYPYGQENDYNTTCSPTYKFTGYEFDSETGNYYAYAREYDPRIGRFLSADPLGGAIGDPQSLNRYSYVINNPVSFLDPEGLGPCQVGAPVGASCTIVVTAGSGGGGGWNGGFGGSAGGTYYPFQDTGYLHAPGGPGPVPQTQVSCAALRQEAAQLGATLESMSHSAALGAAGLWFTTAIGAVFELPSFGADSPVTIALGAGGAFFTAAAIDSGAVGSALNSFASGNLNPLESFAFNQIEDLALKGLASGIPKVGPWAGHLANAAQQAQDLANEAPGACK